MKIVVVFGTRPEAIKLAPVIAELRRHPHIDVHVVTTAQHRELLDQVLEVFAIVPDADLQVMRPRQTLGELTGRVLEKTDALLAQTAADLLVVQGDTTSAFAAALAAFYRGVPVAHVEAGLRTGSPANPFPEEMNRRLTGAIAALHFAPTRRAHDALVAEGVAAEKILTTGNTVVDALQQIRQSGAFREARERIRIGVNERLLLVTLHRRESWGAPLAGMCAALRQIVEARPEVRMILPVHLNPAVREIVHEHLGGVPRVSLVEPMDYFSFVATLEASWLVLTDSGGVQEEAPVLGCPVLVLRDTTERPEAIEHGVATLVGTKPAAIIAAAMELLEHPERRDRMAQPVSPFGDGHAAARIAGRIAALAHEPAASR